MRRGERWRVSARGAQCNQLDSAHNKYSTEACFTNPNDKTRAVKLHLRQTAHIPQEKHTMHTPMQRLQQQTHTLGVLSLMAERSESEELTSPANTVHPVCVSEAESSSENSRCSPPHHKHDLQSENRSLYSHNEVRTDQKQI